MRPSVNISPTAAVSTIAPASKAAHVTPSAMSNACGAVKGGGDGSVAGGDGGKGGIIIFLLGLASVGAFSLAAAAAVLGLASVGAFSLADVIFFYGETP